MSLDCNPGQLICTTPCPSSLIGCPGWSSGGAQITHNITTSNLLTFNGAAIPICKTTRRFSESYSSSYSADACGSRTEGNGTISDIIDYEAATLHYINTADGVLLYRYTKASVKLEGSGSEFATMWVATGTPVFYLLIRAQLSYTLQTDWRLIRDGQETVLHSELSSPQPGPINFLAPQPPPSQMGVIIQPEYDLPWYNKYDSCYDAAPDSLTALDGGRDYYYPEWARAITPDPYWRRAADRRFAICQGGKLQGTVETLTLSPTCNPYPVGGYAKHPALGEAYSWLLPVTGDTLTFNFPDRLPSILAADIQAYNDKLASDQATLAGLLAKTTFYPISLI